MVSCSICFKPYNEVEHRPKVLSCCGHTFCLKCLLTMEAAKRTTINCPKCDLRMSQRGATKFLDNFELISLMNKPVKEVDPDCSRLFCLDCDKEAKSACLDVHTLRGLAGYRRERLQEAVADLELQVKKALERCKRLESKKLVDQELQLLRCQLPVTISSDPWSAEAVDLQRQPALRLALLQLLQEGKLKTQPQSPKRTLQSPKRTLLSPKRTLLSPKRFLQSPKRTLLSPKRTLQSPKRTLLSPKRTLQSPKRTLLSPKRTLQSPKRTLLSPKRTLLSPKRTLQSPSEEPQRKQPRVEKKPEQPGERVRQGEADAASEGLDYFHDHGRGRRGENSSRTALLSREAGTLQEVHLDMIDPEEFLQLQRMPRLRKLSVASDYLPKVNPVLPRMRQQQARQGGGQNNPTAAEWQGRLEWLRVRGLRKDTTLAMLEAHRDSLRELALWVGPLPESGTTEESWPETCGDLHWLLLDCGLRKLSHVTLLRWLPCDKKTCSRQLARLRATLPHCVFTCSNEGR